MTTSFGDLLHRAGQAHQAIWIKHAPEGVDLTQRQYSVLLAVANNPGCSQSAIVTLTNIDRSTVHALIERMISKGLIKRRDNPRDARAYEVTLTPFGRRSLDVGENIQAAVNAEIMGRMSSRDLTAVKRVVEILDKVAA